MKRSQPAVMASSSSPVHKKLKMTPSSNNFEQLAVTENNDDDGEWTKVEKRKAKKVKKVETKLDAAPPLFMYSGGEIKRRREAVGISDVRDLVLHIVADAPPQSWVKVENARSMQKLVVLLIPGLTAEHLLLPPPPTSATENPNIPVKVPYPPKADNPIPFFANTFSHACPTRAPGEQTKMYSILSAFFQGPVTGEEKRRRAQERLMLELHEDKNPRRYQLTLEEMIEHEYPVPSYMAQVFEKGEGWIEIPNVTSDKPAQIYAIDCEMVLTEDGKELARVCVIDYETGKVIFDKMARPNKPIIDYLTRWSGITAEAMKDVKTTFVEIQQDITKLLLQSPTPILAGHSLESDLKAMKISYPRCIDTAVIYHHPRGRPLKPGLAWLTKKWCGREIQNRGDGGHDPEEDARACLDLVRKKADNGPGYGEFKTDQESIFERMSRSTKGVRSAVIDHGSPGSWHGSKATATVSCQSDDEVLNGLLDVIPTHNFIFGRFTELADASGWITSKSQHETTVSISESLSPVTPKPTLSISAALTNLNTHLTRVYQSLPARTGFIILTGHSDPRKMTALNTRKALFENALRMNKSMEEINQDGTCSWRAQDGRDLEEEVEKAKRGLMFLCVKSSSGGK